ncbi:AMP-binding protein [Streptomyces sp. NPDC001205]
MTGKALLDGGPAITPAVATLADALIRTARCHGRQKIVFLHTNGTHTALTYSQLLDDARRILAGLRRTLNQPGDIILLDTPDPQELVTAYWACQLGGYVPLPVPDRDGLLDQVWTVYRQPRFITGSGRTVPAGMTPYATGTYAYLLGHAPDPHHHQGRPEDLALLLLTSGSTGTPKAVRLTHRNILTRTTATAHVNRLDHRRRTLNWMPLDHVGGLVMFHTRDTYLGAYQVHAPQPWILDGPLRWLDTIHTHRITCTWAPNYAFALVNDALRDGSGAPWDLTCLTYIMNGGEPLRAGVIKDFMTGLARYGLPRDAMYPGWGMSETSSGVTDCPFTEHPGRRYVPVGRPQPGTRIRIVTDDGTLADKNTVGHVQVAGATVTDGYHHGDDQTRQSFTPDGWFTTGDLGSIDGTILTVTGRADDRITLAGVIYHGHEIEAAVEELDIAAPTYTVATPVTTTAGENLAVFFHPKNGHATPVELGTLHGMLAARFGITGARLLPVGKDDIPKTGIGKLRRAPLRQRYESTPEATWTPVPSGG